MYQKIQDGRHVENLTIVYYKWRPFCFFRKKYKLFLVFYLSNELCILENIQLDTSLIYFVSLSWTLWPTVVLVWKVSAILDLC